VVFFPLGRLARKREREIRDMGLFGKIQMNF
jgi:hypothetical protein